MASPPYSKTGSSATDGTSAQVPPILNQQNINPSVTTGSPVVITPTSNPANQGSKNRGKGGKGYTRGQNNINSGTGYLGQPFNLGFIACPG
ncbi:hypothetical protein QYF36_014044 [Acer negundo]|nr:hypothetical protein QYF36_014044 [Acer negundo]